jgi:nucleoside-diphosphate-sugar epimerase
MIEDARAGDPTHFPFGRDFFRQYVHVDDVADAILLALDAGGLRQSAYTITGGDYRTLGEVAEIVRKIVPSADITMEAGRDPIDDVQACFDISAAASDLGYRPRIELEEGIRSYAAWLGAQGPSGS